MKLNEKIMIKNVHKQRKISVNTQNSGPHKFKFNYH